MECLKGDGGHSAFQRLLNKVRDESLDVQAAVSLLRLCQNSPTAKVSLFTQEQEGMAPVQPKGRWGWAPWSSEGASFDVPSNDLWWLSHRFYMSFQKLRVKHTQAEQEATFLSLVN